LKISKMKSRRMFLNFMGRGAVMLGASSSIGGMISACANAQKDSDEALPLKPISPSLADDVICAEGLKSEILIKWGDPINSRGERFGFNNDYTAFIPFEESNGDEGYLWVNHEYPNSVFMHQKSRSETPSKKDIDRERKALGGSLLHVRKKPSRDGFESWEVLKNDRVNRRISGETKIPLIADRPIFERNNVTGTFANCAGGITPWRTFLTCEENYHYQYGEVSFESGKRKISRSGTNGANRWHLYYDEPPEHFGWVVEVNPRSGKARKLTALGRFAHEGAAVVNHPSEKHTVVYMGDDAEDEHVYKFISDKAGSLRRGTLYVARFDRLNGEGEWIPLIRESREDFKSTFKDQTDLLIRTREAAKMVGATPLERPEDIEIDPITGSIYVALTNHKDKGDYYGSLLKIEEKNADSLSLEFKAESFLEGGLPTGFACPDNLVFDPRGNLWMTTDISGSSIGEGPYQGFGNNGLFYIPLRGPQAGEAFQVASAPVGAEFTGPSFSPDGKTLFLSVQHPGEGSKLGEKPTSRWPGGSMPKPAVVIISGPTLNRLMG
jgi:hypothetical protein